MQVIKNTSFIGNALGGQLDLIEKLNSIIMSHPNGSDFKILLITSELTISNNEVLTQEVDQEKRLITIRPTRIESLATDSSIFATSTVDLKDSSSFEALEKNLDDFCNMGSRVPKHLVRFANGEKIHVTD